MALGTGPARVGTIGRVSSPASLLAPYDALLLVSFGGPEAPEEVIPFLERVTAGRGIPHERLFEVAEHYYRFGGRSPINEQNRALLGRLRAELDRRGLAEVPLQWGNRNAPPLLDDVVPGLARDGHRELLAMTTSAYPSYSSCRQYRENLYDAAASAPQVHIDRIRNYASHPAFAAAWVDTVDAAWGSLDLAQGSAPRLVFVTHSIPAAMAETAGPSRAGRPAREPSTSGTPGEYETWHRAVAAAVAHGVAARRDTSVPAFDLVYCSRSGPARVPWLEPDINDHLERLVAEGVTDVIVAPIGFISDHMEVIYDLDTEARETADRLGLRMARAATISEHPAFVSTLVDLACERAAARRGEQPVLPSLPGLTAGPYECPADCCPNLRRPDRPALCQTAVPAPGPTPREG